VSTSTEYKKFPGEDHGLMILDLFSWTIRKWNQQFQLPLQFTLLRYSIHKLFRIFGDAHGVRRELFWNSGVTQSRWFQFISVS
jgi:hypothetical protein